ncbi:putative ribonuclease H-like domain-containing protein [Tanacetum coccineum]
MGVQNKKDDRGIVVRNKARLVAQGYTQEEGIDYDEVFAPVARIEAIRLFLACASFMNFIVYQMDVESAFLYGTIEEEVEKALYGLHQAPRAWYETLSTYLLENGFRRGTIDKTLFIKKDKGDILFVQVKQKDEGIFIRQDKYVADILKKFDFAKVKIASTPMETNKALLKDEEAADVDVHLNISMIGLLIYLTAFRPDIMFAVCSCARFQVTPKTSHLHVVKRIFRYLKGHPKLGLWYSRDSPFILEAFSDSDYAGASLDRKSTTGGCQFLGRKFISWQCKKQTIVANSTTEVEYVAAANGCGQVKLRLINMPRTLILLRAILGVLQQVEEHGELTIEERSKLFVELMDKRKKHFAKLRAEEIRRKPPTKAQKRNQICTYLKNMANYKHSQLKNKSFEEIQMLFDNTMKWVDSFVPMDSEVVKGGKEKDEGNVTRAEESSSKRAGIELEQERIKKQKIDDDQEEAEMKKHMEIVVDEEEIAVDAIPLATRPPIIID